MKGNITLESQFNKALRQLESSSIFAVACYYSTCLYLHMISGHLMSQGSNGNLNLISRL